GRTVCAGLRPWPAGVAVACAPRVGKVEDLALRPVISFGQEIDVLVDEARAVTQLLQTELTRIEANHRARAALGTDSFEVAAQARRQHLHGGPHPTAHPARAT